MSADKLDFDYFLRKVCLLNISKDFSAGGFGTLDGAFEQYLIQTN